MQEICISDAEALSKLLPGEPCLPEGCNCQADGDCPGENGRYVLSLVEFMSDLNDTFTILLATNFYGLILFHTFVPL